MCVGCVDRPAVRLDWQFVLLLVVIVTLHCLFGLLHTPEGNEVSTRSAGTLVHAAYSLFKCVCVPHIAL